MSPFSTATITSASSTSWMAASPSPATATGSSVLATSDRFSGTIFTIRSVISSGLARAKLKRAGSIGGALTNSTGSVALKRLSSRTTASTSSADSDRSGSTRGLPSGKSRVATVTSPSTCAP